MALVGFGWLSEILIALTGMLVAYNFIFPELANPEQINKETLKWLNKINKNLGNKLTKETLLKTGGEDSNTPHQTRERKIPDEILVERNKTTSDSLNYAKTSGTMR